MEIIRQSLELSKEEYYMKHLQIVNQFLPVQMTPKEIEALAIFMSLDGVLAEDRFGTTARKIVMDKMNIKPGGLGNYLKSLLDEGFIYKNEIGRIKIKEFLIPNGEKQGYQFLLKKKDES